MADGSYNILVGIEPDVTGLQQKLDRQTKNIKIKTSINMGQKDIDSYVKQWNNQISRMQFKSPDIFKNEEVQANLKVLQNNITNFSQRGGASVQDVRGSFDDLKTSVTKVGASMKNTTKDGYGFTSMLDVAIKKVAVWMIATQAVYGSLRKLEEGVQYIKDLNVELTNLQIVTGKTDEEIAQLARDYGYLAQQVGATTIEVAQGSLEWARQGKTAEETSVLLRTSMMLSKLAAMDSAEATEKLTAVMNGFQLSVEEVGYALDVLIILDNAYATSAEEIITAMQRSSNSAQLVGIEYNELASQITIVSSVTRKSAESIGESLKTIYSRMRNVKLGKQFDEEGESISDVEEVLKDYNIALRDTTGNFRDFSYVLDEVGEIWGELETIDQSKIANAFAGIRQSENFIVLLNNWDKVKEAQDLAADSAGLAAERYEIYMGGIEASANRMKSAWEGVWAATIDPEAIAFFNDLSTAIANFITRSGGLLEFFNSFVEIQKFIGVLAPAKFVFAGIETIVDNLIFLVAKLFGKEYQQDVKDYQKELQKVTDEYILWKDILNLLGLEDSNLYDIVMRGLEGEIDALNEISGLQSEMSSESRSDEVIEDNEQIEESNSRLMKSFENLQFLIDDSFGKAFDSYHEKQEQSAIQAAELREEIRLLSEQPTLSEEQLTQLGDLQYELYNVEQDILKTAEAYEKSLQAAIISTFMQRVALADLSSDAQTAAYNMVYSLAESWGLMGEETVRVSRAVDTAILELANGSYEAAQIAISNIMNVGNAAAAISGNYYLNFVVTTSGNVASPGTSGVPLLDGMYSPEDLMSQAFNPPPTNIPTRSSFPGFSGFGGGGGGGGSSAAPKAEIKTLKDLHNLVISLIKAEQKARKDALKDQIDGLEAQLDAYAEIIDAKKEILRAEQESIEYQETLEDKTKTIAQIQSEMAILALDTSAESKARQLELAEELADAQKDLAETQRDRSYDLQEEALDKEYDLYKENTDAQIAIIEEAVSAIDEYLDKTGQIAQDALDRIGEQAPDLYQSLIDWNAEYGSGIVTDVVDAWNEAYDALLKYGNLADALYGGVSPTVSTETLPTHHSGLSSGAVGGVRTLPGEILSKLLVGEEVMNDNDILKTLKMIPRVANIISRTQGSGGGLNIENLITIQGDVIEKTIPKIKDIAKDVIKEINSTLVRQGSVRDVASIYG